MSFWKDVGNFLDDAGSSTTDAFSSAWTFASDDGLKSVGHAIAQGGRGLNDTVGPNGPLGQALAWPGGALLHNPVTEGALDGLGTAYHAAVDRPVSAYGNVISDPNELGTFNLLSPSKISAAWNAAGQNDGTAGESVVQTLAGVSQAPTPDAAQERENFQSTWSGKLSSGAADFAIGWYADPLVVGGKASKAIRQARTTIKSNEERTKVLQYAEGRINAPQAGKRAQKLGDRFNKMIESTDGLNEAELAQHGALKSSSDAGALAYLFGKANMELGHDAEALHAQKRTIFGAALGDAKSIDRLKSQRSELADEMKNLVEPPIPTRFAEKFTWDDHGQGAWDLFNQTMEPLDERLADQITQKMNKYDRAISTAGTTSTVTAKAVKPGEVRQGFIYSGLAGPSLRWVAGASQKRLPFHVNIKDPVEGLDQFQGFLKGMQHSPQEVREGLLQQFVKSSSAGERRTIVARAESYMVRDTAERYGLGTKEALALIKAGQGRRATALKSLTSKLYSATDADKWIHVMDPEEHEIVAISKPLLRTQIEDSMPFMDPFEVDKFLKSSTNRRALEVFADKYGKRELATKVADTAEAGADWADHILRFASARWKDMALMRLAYPARVQVDTQMRLMTQMGGLQWMGAMKGAAKGQFKYLLQDTAGNKNVRNIFSDQKDFVGALEGTLMKGGEYRGIPIAPARDADEVKRIADRIWQHNGGMADILSEVSSSELGKMRSRGGWVAVGRDHPEWEANYTRAVNRQIFSSPTARKALLTTDPVDLRKWVLSTREGQLEWAEMKPGWKNIDAWLAKVRDHVDHYVPEDSGLREILDQRQLTEADLKYFRGNQQGNRMMIHGEAFAPNSETGNLINRKFQKYREKWYDFAAEAPETILGRSPLYGHMFKSHMREQIDRLADNAEVDVEQMRRNADRLARRDVGKVLFDSSDTSNMAHHFALVAPFFAAWEDTMRKWGKLIYDDPGRAGRLLQVWHAPNNAGLVVDSEGNRVDAQGHVYDSTGKRRDTDKNYRGNGNYIVMPVPHAAARMLGWGDVGSVRFNKDSINVVFQGEPWWLPGMGPLVQIPANEFVKKSFPESVDNPVIKYVLPYGTTNDDIGTQLLPSWVKQAKNAFGNTQDYSNISSMILAQETVRYNLGERKDRPTPDEVAGKARNWFIMRALMSNASPVSAAPTPRFQMYVDKAHEYQSKYGREWEGKFYKDFPEYFEMSTSLSQNDTGIVASEKAFDATKRYKAAIADNPEYGWMFVGPANDPAQPFNQGVYTWQSGTPISKTSDQTYRSKKSPQEALQEAEASKGWIEYQQIKTGLDDVLHQRGLYSMSSKGAEDVKAVWDAFRADLSGRNEYWARDYGNRGPDRVKGLVDAARDGIQKDKSLKDRGDFKALDQYLTVRKQIQAVLATRSIKSLDRPENADVKEVWDGFTADLKLSNFGFSQMFDKVLEADDLKGELSLG